MEDATLTRLVDSPERWQYQFQMPTDCLRVMQLNGVYFKGRRGYFVVQKNRLFTDEQEAKIQYIQCVTDGSFYPPIFVEALSTKLASRIAKTLTGSDSMAQSFFAEYKQVTGPEARRMDAYVNYQHPVPAYYNSDLVNSRFRCW